MNVVQNVKCLLLNIVLNSHIEQGVIKCTVVYLEIGHGLERSQSVFVT